MSLADELLADFDDVIEEVIHIEDEDWTSVTETLEEKELDPESPHQIAKLLENPNFQSILYGINLVNDSKVSKFPQGVSNDTEYKLIIKASAITVDIANEVNILHKFIRDIYTERFSELEKIVLEPMSYIRTVYKIKNNLDLTKTDLTDLLPPHIIMIVSVSASTSQGIDLDDLKLKRLNEACEMAFLLEDAVLKITKFVESRMEFIAPNLSAICGPSTAAKLMGQAGGIMALAKMPACNLQVLGSEKKTITGFSNISNLPHCGYIYFSELIDPLPLEYKRKATRMVSCRCSLAIRLDSNHEYPDGSKGKEFRKELEKKIEKIMEPPPARLEKPLAPPDEIKKKRRGGRRVRKAKKRMMASEVDKAINKLKFGEIQDDLIQTKIGYDIGMLGKGGTGQIRTAQIDNKVRTTITKRMQRELARQRAYGGYQTSHTSKSSISSKSYVAGTSSSVVYSKDIGLEINNPAAAEKVSEIEGKYFSSVTTFKKSKN